MPTDDLKKKRQTYWQLIAMALIWSGFVFFLERLATQGGQTVDYSGQHTLFVLVWVLKVGGIITALIGLWLLIGTYRNADKQEDV